MKSGQTVGPIGIYFGIGIGIGLGMSLGKINCPKRNQTEHFLGFYWSDRYPIWHTHTHRYRDSCIMGSGLNKN